MLANSTIESGINLSEVFAGMLREMPWNSLRDYLQANPQVFKRCSAGGHRLEKKHRERFEKIILSEAVKAEFSPAFRSAVFAHWYPVHEQLHRKLEDYFHSDEYKRYRQEKELAEDQYVLPQDKFAEFFTEKEIPQWRILLCFSPLEFDDRQAEAVLHHAAGSEELIKQVRQLQDELAQAAKEKTLLSNENQELRNRLEQLNRDSQEIRQERKQLKAERDALQAKYETLHHENRRAREAISRKDEKLEASKESAAKSANQEIARLQRDLTRVNQEIEDWKSKYEKQRLESRALQEKLRETEKALAEERNAHQTTRRQISKAENFADVILARLDWVEIGRQLHLPPQLKRKFNSLIKSLSYDQARNLTLGANLSSFWNTLQAAETELVQAIAESDTREVEAGEVEQFWLSLTDAFEDVYISLEARAILLKMLQDIFYQTIDMKDLEAGRVPSGKSGKK